MRDYMRDYKQRIKLKVLIHYSGTDPPQCANPFGEHKEPYTNILALSVDHIDGGGTQHRENQGHGNVFYLWLIKNNYPEGYQCLCMNCQFIKRKRNKEVPRHL